MKPCPFCAEQIQDAAVFCRHCHHDLKTGRIEGAAADGPRRYWSPGIAGLLSFLIPGAGSMYKGQVAVGILLFILTVGGYFLFVVPGIVMHLVAIVAATSGDPTRDPAVRPGPTVAAVAAEQRRAIPATPGQLVGARKRARIGWTVAGVALVAIAALLLAAARIGAPTPTGISGRDLDLADNLRSIAAAMLVVMLIAGGYGVEMTTRVADLNRRLRAPKGR